ncbi:hypothetical protein EV363DRAFT_1297750 [Boletus edulis]|nr:hypothetical protein EV363DRAFT_1297750 [Boletus edulis]
MYAWHALANDMVNKLGWPFGCSAQNAYKDAVKEVIEQANNTLHRDLKLDTDIETVIIKELSYVCSKLVEAAEEYTERLFETHDAALASDTARYKEWKTSRLGNVSRWFRNTILKSLHINFWYTSNTSPIKYFVSTYHTTPTQMYTLLATALLCASRRVAMGCKHNSGNTIAFTGDKYGPIFHTYHTAILEYANHADICTDFNLRMDWLNAEGLFLVCKFIVLLYKVGWS